ncbi:vesicle-associated membrane protein 8 isoform 1-T1 [Spinachia spinachia]
MAVTHRENPLVETTTSCTTQDEEVKQRSDFTSLWPCKYLCAESRALCPQTPAPAGLRLWQLMADAHPQAPGPGSTAKLDQVQNQVNEVKVILKDNISKVLERGERLDDLIGKTDDLQASADSFQKTSTRVARKYWWKNVKMMIIIGVVVLIIVILIILFATGVI